MDADQEKFLSDEIFSLTLMATVQRAGVYRSNASDRERRAFRIDLRSKLEEIATTYEVVVEEETHVRNVVELSRRLTSDHKKVLSNGRFRIGTAQKALNLYLKYLWCLGAIPQPPHCPFDFQVITTLSEYHGPKWTDLDREEDYRSLIAAAKLKAQGVPLAVWELRTYNNVQPRAAVAAPQAARR
jgi:hypothetical protein